MIHRGGRWLTADMTDWLTDRSQSWWVGAISRIHTSMVRGCNMTRTHVRSYKHITWDHINTSIVYESCHTFDCWEHINYTWVMSRIWLYAREIWLTDTPTRDYDCDHPYHILGVRTPPLTRWRLICVTWLFQRHVSHISSNSLGARASRY